MSATKSPTSADPYTSKAKANEPSTSEKLTAFTTFIKTCKFGMFVTRVGETGQLTSRAMALAATENDGIDLLFHTNTESGKTDSIESDGAVNMSFIDGSGQWASVAGTASVDTDRESVRKHYSPELKAWLGDLGDGKHDGGPEDPRIGIIRMKSDLITYSITDRTFIGRAYEVAKGVATGETPSFMSVRDITKEELESIRSGSA